MSRIVTYNKGSIPFSVPSGTPNEKGEIATVCPSCSADRKPEHQKEKVFSVNVKRSPMPWRCNHCGEMGYVLDDHVLKAMAVKPVARSFNFLPIGEKVLKWFKQERGISKATLDHFRISTSQETMMMRRTNAETEQYKGKALSRMCINFKYIMDGVLVNVKFRDQNKNFKLVSGADLVFYNIDSIKESKQCLIVEGEPDCLSYHEAGYTTVISVPNGATITADEIRSYKETGIMTTKSLLNMEYMDLCLPHLEHIEQFIIGTDDDPAGVKLRMELARRLGFDRCTFIKYSDWKKPDGTPCKDGNEILVALGPSALLSTLLSPNDFPLMGVNEVRAYSDVLLKNFRDGKEKGLTTGYKSFDPHFKWMRSWLTVFNGYPTQGKTSLVLNLIAISTVLYGWKWGIYSPENYPAENLIDTMAEILLGNTSDKDFGGRASEEEFMGVITNHLQKHIFIVDNENGYTPEELRELKLRMVKKYGIVGFLTDPWLALNHVYKGSNSIDTYIEHQLNAEIRLTTKYTLINVITHHPPTPKDKRKIEAPTAFDLVGGQIWWNKVFALLCIHKVNQTMDNTLANIFVHKMKEQKRAGHPTDDMHAIILNYQRRTNRFLEREVITDENSPFTRYPIEDYGSYSQVKLDGF
jgi:twinkle protein